MAPMTRASDCARCDEDARLDGEDVEDILLAYLREYGGQVADDETVRRRLQQCLACEALLRGTTCRHCGCYVQVMAKLAAKRCPAPRPLW